MISLFFITFLKAKATKTINIYLYFSLDFCSWRSLSEGGVLSLSKQVFHVSVPINIIQKQESAKNIA
jgi:hypothetical protein